jgi:hypothetical protein
MPSMYEVIADQGSDEAHWKMQRRRHLTSSDVFKFLPEDVLREYGWWVEQWMARDGKVDKDIHWARQEALTRKVTGAEPDFGDPVKVRWGRAEEAHFRSRFAEYTGLEIAEDHSLLRHARWPHIAASLDSWVIKRRNYPGVKHPEMFVLPDQVETAVAGLPDEIAVHLEMKTTSDFGVSTWLKGKRSTRSKVIAGEFRPYGPHVPVYYQAQCLTQMAICGIPENLAVVQGGISNMTCHLLLFMPTWLEVLDLVEEEIADKIDYIREVLDGK